MNQRLYLPEVPEAGERTTLDKDRSHYLLRVLRLRDGSEFFCFDGHGNQWRVRILNTEGRRVTLETLALDRQEAAPTDLILAQGWLKGGAMDTVVQKATELGVSRIIPLVTERCNVHLHGARLAQRLLHLQRIAISASEQSGRLFVPEVSEPQSLTGLLASAPASPERQTLMLDLNSPALQAGTRPTPLLLLIGPEGGWSEGERTQARSTGAIACGLGDLTLRAETAPLVVLAAIRHSWHWQR
ncbi:MAG: 16S rRNA (uracil(1498)-N(3))-methyltransferase [Pseudomonadales bacterium]|nr:16S rRNA (uracil(1498)-N(3))-methyltransferase [Pseudomonadales bacterium]